MIWEDASGPSGIAPLSVTLASGASLVDAAEPTIEIERARLPTGALSTVGKTTLSGVQKKISVGISDDRQTLRADVDGTYFDLLRRRTVTA